MATLKELHITLAGILFRIRTYGATAKAMAEFNKLCENALAAIMKEQKITDPEETISLPGNTKLGKESQASLKALKKFEKEN